MRAGDDEREAKRLRDSGFAGLALGLDDLSDVGRGVSASCWGHREFMVTTLQQAVKIEHLTA